MIQLNLTVDKFKFLSKEARELYLENEVTELNECPTALKFLKNFVSTNCPLIVRGGCKNWPAIHKWTNEYLRNKIGDNLVTITSTPNGYADAIYQNLFTLPHESRMTFSNFLDILQKHKNIDKPLLLMNNDIKDIKNNNCKEVKEDDGVHYAQKQNSSLTDEYSSLMVDVADSIPWAAEAFGNQPDAVNFWMGDKRAVTSLHKDHYENMYCVIRGNKFFTLFPPTDQGLIPYNDYQQATFSINSQGKYTLKSTDDNAKVRWCPVDPEEPTEEIRIMYPEFYKLRPIKVTLGAGDILYLPSLWFHRVSQTHECIAVNYWHDMQYDIKYTYFKFIELLSQSISDDSNNKMKKRNENEDLTKKEL